VWVLSLALYYIWKWIIFGFLNDFIACVHLVYLRSGWLMRDFWVFRLLLLIGGSVWADFLMGFLRLLIFSYVEEWPSLIVLNLWVRPSAILLDKGASFIPGGLECWYCFIFLFDRFSHSLLQEGLSLNGFIDPRCSCVWYRHDCHEVLEGALQCVS